MASANQADSSGCPPLLFPQRFLGARHPNIANSGELAYKATEQDILLGPGHLFGPDMQPSPWMRFNVAFCEDPAIFDYLSAQCPPLA